jgi:hypothetical protein
LILVCIFVEAVSFFFDFFVVAKFNFKSYLLQFCNT